MLQLEFLEASYSKECAKSNDNSYEGPFVLDSEYQRDKKIEIFSKLYKLKINRSAVVKLLKPLDFLEESAKSITKTGSIHMLLRKMVKIFKIVW